MSDETKEKELEAASRTGRKLAEGEGRHRFPEITGLCRTCTSAHITRTRYSEVPTVVCEALFGSNHQVPLDIVECSSYSRRGQLSLDEMGEMALFIDVRRVKTGFAR